MISNSRLNFYLKKSELTKIHKYHTILNLNENCFNNIAKMKNNKTKVRKNVNILGPDIDSLKCL